VIYVPYYDQIAIYGPWWWPTYPPMFWSPWMGYGWHRGLAWGDGVGIGGNFFFGSFGWRTRSIIDRPPYYSGKGHTWQHDPDHRHGVPYRDASLNLHFGRPPAAPAPRAEYRGYEQSITPHAGVSASHTPSELAHPAMLQRTGGPSTGHRTLVAQRAHALENVGQGVAARNFSARGQASLKGSTAAHSGRTGH